MSKDNKYLVVENYIGGKFVPCSKLIDSFNPSTGEIYCKVPDSGPEEVDAAVRAAKEAFPEWSAKSPAERSKVLNKLADLIEARVEEFAQAESKDQGKAITFARNVDIPRAAYNFRFFASSVLHHTNDCSQMDHMGCLNYTIRCPVGVAGLISPWNLPLYLLTWKIAPAVATGNTVVAKPSEMTSVTAWMMCQLLEEAGFPPGVVNIVFGTGPRAGDALVSHPDVPLISFTGSTATARLITERSAPYCKKLSLELGGKNPAIIFADADMEQCISTTVRSSFSNQGEICLCTSRIFVERSIYPEFLARFVEAARRWKTGVPSDPANDNGALISKEHLQKMSRIKDPKRDRPPDSTAGRECLGVPSIRHEGDVLTRKTATVFPLNSIYGQPVAESVERILMGEENCSATETAGKANIVDTRHYSILSASYIIKSKRPLTASVD
ncbi:hypothetical protein QQF64_021193 [Cirrhinus molitorella]|uniref:Aldehyde dehydrogenase domain-containing protein n=1 Tax=Cirrhinus molitorella TaxID=172907 RepID=A0ABR3LF93_9TELE